MNDRKAQFFIIASVVILLSLIMISQYIIKSTFPVSERPIDEFSFSKDIGSVIGDISMSAPPYLVKRDIWALNRHTRSATSWMFGVSLCCGDVCDCSSLNLENFTAPQGQGATLTVASKKATISSSLSIKSTYSTPAPTPTPTPTPAPPPPCGDTDMGVWPQTCTDVCTSAGKACVRMSSCRALCVDVNCMARCGIPGSVLGCICT